MKLAAALIALVLLLVPVGCGGQDCDPNNPTADESHAWAQGQGYCRIRDHQWIDQPDPMFQK